MSSPRRAARTPCTEACEPPRREHRTPPADGATPTAACAFDSARRFVDTDGVVYLTNVPADPRLRGLPGAADPSGGLLGCSRNAGTRYTADIREIAREHALSPVLIEAIVRTESGFASAAFSRGRGRTDATHAEDGGGPRRGRPLRPAGEHPRGVPPICGISWSITTAAWCWHWRPIARARAPSMPTTGCPPTRTQQYVHRVLHRQA